MTTGAEAPGDVARYCDRCGGPLAGPAGHAGHPGCAAARELEPPRYCAQCGRRMKVQVVPAGWTASCVVHGERRSG